jgi:hypothetical protein
MLAAIYHIIEGSFAAQAFALASELARRWMIQQ